MHVVSPFPGMCDLMQIKGGIKCLIEDQCVDLPTKPLDWLKVCAKKKGIGNNQDLGFFQNIRQKTSTEQNCGDNEYCYKVFTKLISPIHFSTLLLPQNYVKTSTMPMPQYSI